MKDAIILFIILIYIFSVVCLTCYMTINHGWYWIFLLLLCDIKYTHKNNDKDGG